MYHKRLKEMDSEDRKHIKSVNLPIRMLHRQYYLKQKQIMQNHMFHHKRLKELDSEDWKHL